MTKSNDRVSDLVTGMLQGHIL